MNLAAKLTRIALLSGGLLFTACGDDDGPSPDAGTDAGPTRPDAGREDDAGTGDDAGTEDDAGVAAR